MSIIHSVYPIWTDREKAQREVGRRKREREETLLMFAALQL